MNVTWNTWGIGEEHKGSLINLEPPNTYQVQSTELRKFAGRRDEGVVF